MDYYETMMLEMYVFEISGVFRWLTGKRAQNIAQLLKVEGNTSRMSIVSSKSHKLLICVRLSFDWVSSVGTSMWSSKFVISY